MKNADANLIKTICEIIHNILRGNVNLKPETRSALEKYKKELRCLACTKRNTQKKRKIIIQKGAGFVPLIIGSILSSLAGSIADRLINPQQK